jgi:hemin uptake protein HemP
MSQPPRSTRPNEAGGDTADLVPPVVDSATLMAGRRELVIRHGVDTYRLRITASNKLILTK